MQYSKQDLRDALSQAGIQRGDTLFIHANLGFFGRMTDVNAPAEYPAAFLDVFLDLIGPEGTLCVPAFTYSFCNGLPYDKQTTPAPRMGIFSECVRVYPDAFRSDDANFSVSIIGSAARELSADCPVFSFGEDSIFDRLRKRNGKICNLNFDYTSTFIHYAEKANGAPYRFDKRFEGVSLIDGTWQPRFFYHFVRHLDRPDWELDIEKYNRELAQSGLANKAALGRGAILCMDMQQVFAFISNKMHQNTYYFTAGCS